MGPSGEAVLVGKYFFWVRLLDEGKGLPSFLPRSGRQPGLDPGTKIEVNSDSRPGASDGAHAVQRGTIDNQCVLGFLCFGTVGGRHPVDFNEDVLDEWVGAIATQRLDEAAELVAIDFPPIQEPVPVGITILWIRPKEALLCPSEAILIPILLRRLGMESESPRTEETEQDPKPWRLRDSAATPC